MAESMNLSGRIRFAILMVMLAACCLGGGSSREDVLSLLFLRPILVLATAAIFLTPGPIEWRPVRVPLALLACLAMIAICQLIPLPPAIWRSLPGHHQFASVSEIARLPASWRPLSLAPTLTLNSLFSMVTPFAFLTAFAALQRDQRQKIVPVLIGVTSLSAILGLLQVTGGAGSPFYLYRVAHTDSPIGFFSNRNHEAVLLALTLPLLAIWIIMPPTSHVVKYRRQLAAAGIGFFLVPLIVVTGSRAGLFIGLLGLAFASFIIFKAGANASLPSRIRIVVVALVVLISCSLVTAAVLSDRAVAIQRLVLGSETMGSEKRISFTPLMLEMTREFLPLGSGLGSFAPLFKVFESDDSLTPFYFNHAHNDFIELALTAGVPGVILLLVLMAWVANRTWSSFNADTTRSPTAALAWGGACMVVLAALSSMVDYPLRTPLMSALFAIALGWLGGVSPARRRN